ncbi:MAG: ImmA/IrrE family metallo-endopeptidase [Pseudorhodoplanes sp.]|nr:ImmA/IrrE family metallo-endopeptidase [Pseudorhodoplanes sp.]
MSTKPRVARRNVAEAAATVVLREEKITGLRVDPIKIAQNKGILVQAKPDTAKGVSGMLVKAGDEFGIMYATHIPSPGFQKFSIAHEIGHYCIEGHCDTLLTTGVHLSHAGFVSHDPFEQEADLFAAALLMPEAAFKRAIEERDPGLSCIEDLRKECETSLTATAIRYSAMTRDAVAIILSKGDTIDYCFMSDGLKQAKGIKWLRKGTPIPGGTLTQSFNARSEDVQKTSGDGRLNDWMEGDKVYKVTEEVIGLGSYGRTLTVLTCKTLTMRVEEIEDDEEEALVRDWTPRFHR